MPDGLLLALIVLFGLTSLILLFLLLVRVKALAHGEDHDATAKLLEKLERSLRDEFVQNREESGRQAKDARSELSGSMKDSTETLLDMVHKSSRAQKDELEVFGNKLTKLTDTQETKLDGIRDKIADQLKGMQDNNEKKLEQMRQTVDEKLHETLEQRLGDSFKLVSERLEEVHKGLGEMQNLATGVGDLKKVLTNIKTRGTWGEVQLGAIIEQVLTPEQFEKNVATKKGSSGRVEFAVKMPGRKEDQEEPCWLPIDAKFPVEDYQRLNDAFDKGVQEDVEKAKKDLERSVKLQAKTISEKYIDPPHTTDFAIMFLPVEGLYAEVLRLPGLAEELQRTYRVVAAGPTTLSALLNSLQMGFRTVAIEKRSSEVWQILSKVKTEFSKFGDMLNKTQKKLQEASNVIDQAARKSRTIERSLRNVQQLPENSTEAQLSLPGTDIDDED